MTQFDLTEVVKAALEFAATNGQVGYASDRWAALDIIANGTVVVLPPSKPEAGGK